jgi:uncharacterized protein (TIGR00251 family)
MKINVAVVPRGNRKKIEKIGEDNFKVWVTAAPAEGAANKQVVEIVAEYFSVAKSCVAIIGGKTGRRKVLKVMQ